MQGVYSKSVNKSSTGLALQTKAMSIIVMSTYWPLADVASHYINHQPVFSDFLQITNPSHEQLPEVRSSPLLSEQLSEGYGYISTTSHPVTTPYCTSQLVNAKLAYQTAIPVSHHVNPVQCAQNPVTYRQPLYITTAAAPPGHGAVDRPQFQQVIVRPIQQITGGSLLQLNPQPVIRPAPVSSHHYQQVSSFCGLIL